MANVHRHGKFAVAVAKRSISHVFSMQYARTSALCKAHDDLSQNSTGEPIASIAYSGECAVIKPIRLFYPTARPDAMAVHFNRASVSFFNLTGSIMSMGPSNVLYGMSP